jgi:hypothetical protein
MRGVAGRIVFCWDDNNRFSGAFTKIGHVVRAVDDVRDAVLS